MKRASKNFVDNLEENIKKICLRREDTPKYELLVTRFMQLTR